MNAFRGISKEMQNTGMERKGEEGEKKNGFGRYNSSGTDGVGGGVSLFPWLP